MIIVNFNGARDLQACLASLYQQTYTPIEILIIDNASSDDSLTVIETFFAAQPVSPQLPTFTCHRNRENVGFCRGNNQGIQASRGEFILLLNADVTMQPNFIEQLVRVMQSDPAIGITTGKLLRGDDPAKIDSAGIVICKNRRAFDRGQGERDDGQYETVEEVFGASGAACLYRRAMLNEIKYSGERAWINQTGDWKRTSGDEYLDELFFAYKEDIELSWRARLFGWKCVYTPHAVGWHYRTWSATKSRQEIPRRVRRHSLKNRYLMLLKNDCRATWLPSVAPLLWFELQSAGYIVLREPHLLAVICDLIRCAPLMLKKRRVVHAIAQQRGTYNALVRWFHSP